MSHAKAVELTFKFQQEMGMDMRRGGANVIVDYLTDFMSIRYGLDPAAAKALREYAGATPSKGEPGDHDGYYPDNPAFVVQLIDQWKGHIWVRIYESGDVLAPAHITVGRVINRIPLLTKEAQLDAVAGIDVEARSERYHLMALDARDKLQGIMGGLPMSTPHFHELSELLRKLDEMAGQPTIEEPPGHEVRPVAVPLRAEGFTEDSNVFDHLEQAEQDMVVRNMSIPPGYRTPEELIAAMNERKWAVGMVRELLDHIGHGRWEITSHVPAERVDQTEKFLKELKEAMGKLSAKNPASAALLKAAVEIGAAKDAT